MTTYTGNLLEYNNINVLVTRNISDSSGVQMSYKRELLTRSANYQPGFFLYDSRGFNKPRKTPLEYTWMRVNY